MSKIAKTLTAVICGKFYSRSLDFLEQKIKENINIFIRDFSTVINAVGVTSDLISSHLRDVKAKSPTRFGRQKKIIIILPIKGADLPTEELNC